MSSNVPLRTPLQAVPPPNLPLAPTQYSQQHYDVLNNALRLYFNRLNSNLSALSSNIGGAYLQFPNGAFHQDGYTTLTANINSSVTTIAVASTTGFPTTGTLLIDAELINYTGVTPTSFTGCTRGVYGSTAASHLSGAYVAECQAVPSATTSLALKMTVTDASNEVVIDATDKSKIIHNVAGYYNLQFSVQMINYNNQIDNVTFWFRQNGVDVPNSAGIVSVPATHAGKAGAAIISWNLVLGMNAEDYIQLVMASDSGNTVAATYPPGTSPTHPASPAVILTSTFVSALY
jgi:hypothetical protein